jgi:hypothetical protein
LKKLKGYSSQDKSEAALDMESIQKILIDEINKTPESLLQEVLDFLMFINYKHSERQRDNQTPIKPGWQVGFFEEVIGSWEGESLVRDVQPAYELRQDLK